MQQTESKRREFLKALGGTAALLGVGGYARANHTPVHDSLNVGQSLSATEVYWRDIEGETYGAKPDDQGPIGGGDGYAHPITKGDFEPMDLDELIEALSQAKPGDVVFIPEEHTIDLTTYIYIDQFVLEIPEGVTLAGTRGQNGSEGALLESDALKTPVMIQATGPDVRITGLRIQGPNPKRYLAHHRKSFRKGGPRHEYYYKFPTSNGIQTSSDRLTVDNCDISAFSRAAIGLRGGRDHHIHHNFIHHCQYNGLGYGVSHNVSNSVMEYNLFDSNRHSIAGTGAPGCSYIARHNVELGTSLSHCFDMHGGKDREDGTIIAGTQIVIHNNTFRAPEFAIGIRGEAEKECKIYRNWFVQHEEMDEAVRPYPYEGREVFDNAYGENPVRSR